MFMLCTMNSAAFQKMVLDDKDGVKPLFRSRDWNTEERQTLKKEKRFNWFNNKNSKIQYTPGFEKERKRAQWQQYRKDKV